MADLRADDPALTRHVATRMGRTSIGELLDRLREQTSIDLACTDQDRSGDPSIVADIRDAQVWQVMDALRSLVSYRGAMWVWERTPTSSGFRYRLRRPKPAQDLAGSVRDWAQAQFEQSLEVLIAAAQASPEARKAGAGTLNAALWRDPNENADKLLRDERCWDGFRCVADALPTDERGAALRRGVSKQMPVSDLPPPTQEFVMREWRTADAHRRIGPNGPI
ncbi:MAG: hypothetical protein NT029_18035 [Armatimonadetes bacterium]|nr:hypothetical protein [Armatimonadota bacterium]